MVVHLCCFKSSCLSIQPFPYAKLPNWFHPACGVYSFQLTKPGVSWKNVWICVVWNSLSSFISKMNTFGLKHSGNNRLGHFLTCLWEVISPWDILHKSGDLSHSVTQDVVYKQSGIVLSAPQKAFWVLFWQFPWLWVTRKRCSVMSTSQLNSTCQAPGGLPSCRVFQVVQNSWKCCHWHINSLETRVIIRGVERARLKSLWFGEIKNVNLILLYSKEAHNCLSTSNGGKHWWLLNGWGFFVVLFCFPFFEWEN